jgi:hypothetical protein
MRSRNNKVILLKTHYDLEMLCDFLCYSFVFGIERGYVKLHLTHPQLCRWLKQTRNEKDIEVFVHGCVFRMVVIGVDNAPPRRHYSLSLGMSNPPMLAVWWRSISGHSTTLWSVWPPKGLSSVIRELTWQNSQEMLFSIQSCKIISEINWSNL